VICCATVRLTVPPSGRDHLDSLLTKARSLPAVPGVYLMKDAQGSIIYVGKALRLPDRVSSYFVPSADLGYKKQPMLDMVADFDIIECESEWEALLTENRLIKDLKPPPRFNVRLKDGKSFPYLVITQREDYPRIFVSRNPADPQLIGAKVFGPFTNAGSLRQAVSMLQRVFKFRTCSLDIEAGNPRNRSFRPCILYNIKQCTAPCADRITPEAYRIDVDRFVRFLSSKRSSMVRELRTEMELASKELRFEQAAQLRDQIITLEKLDDRASVSDGFQPETEITPIDPLRGVKALQKLLDVEAPIRCIEGFDIAHLQGNQTVASKVSFIDGKPFKDEYRRYKITSVTNNDFDAMREVLSRRYRDAGQGQELYPDLILIDGGAGQLTSAMDVFTSLAVKPPLVISLAKKQEEIYRVGHQEPLRASRTNLGLRLLQSVRDEAHRFAQAYHHILRRKSTLEED
jgi:excinuclease ABC subunit C